ncbi:MAG: HIT family protein [Streptococcaceae bacterium]|jgi:histidine triad (HIT) family protein|nr:HIT family protein [Streptococcaceae bacterium]
MTCIFCNDIRPEQILAETDYFKVVFDIQPIQQGHLLIISKAHRVDIRELSSPELLELVRLERDLTAAIYESFDKIDGVTIVENNGAVMDEGTHLHVHVIPRYKEDDFWKHQVIQLHENNINELKRKINGINR